MTFQCSVSLLFSYSLSINHLQALDEKGHDLAVTFDSDHLCARWTGSSVAGQHAWVGAARRPGL